jgi:carbonic anhydrase
MPPNFFRRQALITRFPGSLTTRPCIENVTWFVLKNPIEARVSQIKMFAKIHKNDARPAQT